MLIICVGCVIPRRIHREFAARPRHTAARPRHTPSLSEVEAQRRQTERLRREVARLQADDGQCARSAVLQVQFSEKLRVGSRPYARHPLGAHERTGTKD